MRETLPWEIVETFPSTDAALIEHWRDRCTSATGTAQHVRASIGAALSLYWAVQLGLGDPPANLAERRELVSGAEELALRAGDPELIATALLGRLYALWGPDHRFERTELLGRLASLAPEVEEPELRLRIIEWEVLECFDTGDLDGARAGAARFTDLARGTASRLRARRVELWRANLAMLGGDLDGAVAMNMEALRATADAAGSPFTYQNASITIAIERYLRCALQDVVESVRSIRASSPRVAANWDAGLAFSLSQCGRTGEAAGLLAVLAEDGFAAVPRDLNWLVTMHLLGLVAVAVEDRPAAEVLLDALEPFAGLRSTHGSGYASYGPAGRVVASLAAFTGDVPRARRVFEDVLESDDGGPWWALTQHDRCVAMAGSDPDAALSAAESAIRELERLGMAEWSDRARMLRGEVLAASPLRPTVRLVGDGWMLNHRLGTARIRGVGAEHLVRLLASPGVPHPAASLDGSLGASGLQDDASVESVADAEAAAAYRRRLQELELRRGPLGDEEVREVEFLRRTLGAARHARSSSPEAERARVRVTKALRRCLESVSEQSPDLGEHLRDSVSTGRSCSYEPADGDAWEVLRSIPG